LGLSTPPVSRVTTGVADGSWAITGWISGAQLERISTEIGKTSEKRCKDDLRNIGLQG
jgi:hypothetical protein